MSATSITQSVQTLKSNILKHVHHRALLQNVGQPTIQEEQLFFIQLPFLTGVPMNDDLMLSATTVGIVQASLLEHEKIKEYDATSKQQQLTVLSGDYYSGRYYQLLAETGNILLIQKLSKGIVNRCEHQIQVYEPKQKTLQQWIDTLTVIECELIAQYYDVYGFTKYIDLMKKTLTYKRLKEEFALLKAGKNSFLRKAFTSNNDQNAIDSIIESVQQELIMRGQELQHIVEQADLQQELKQSIEQYMMI